MKTNVIQLEVHDDVISIKDKMSWLSCQRMILVWPKHGKILHNELELVLLNREAKSLGAELALVTHHPAVREWALDSNLPIFASISSAERTAWKTDARGSLAHKSPKGVDAIKAIKEKLPVQTSSKQVRPIARGLAIAISLAALISILIVILPHVEVTYYPAATVQEVTIKIKASEVFSGINPSGNIPETPEFVEVNGEKSMLSSGKVTIPTTKAAGDVVFSNMTNASVTLPAGTLLLAGNQTLVSFKLIEDVKVPAGLKGSAVGKVEALVAGIEGNLPADSQWTLSGGMDAMVSVSNPDPFNGGGGIDTPTPSEEDYATLERQLLAELMDQGLASLKVDQSEGVGVIEPSLVIEKILLSEQVNKIGEPADEAVLRLNVRLKIYTYQLSDLNTIANLVLSSNQPSGFIPMNDQINLTRVGDFQVDDFGQATWTVHASRLLIPQWDADKTASALAGIKVKDAQAVFYGLFEQKSLPLIKPWLKVWPWMPYLPTNIHFVDGALQ